MSAGPFASKVKFVPVSARINFIYQWNAVDGNSNIRIKSFKPSTNGIDAEIREPENISKERRFLRKLAYLNSISKRADAYRENGGVLDLLEWFGKANTQVVTLKDAKHFYENSGQMYGVPAVLPGPPTQEQ